MIGLNAEAAFEPLAQALEAKARALGVAAAETTALKARAPERVWRKAALLWPLFTKG